MLDKSRPVGHIFNLWVMKVVVNGEELKLQEGATLEQLLKIMNIPVKPLGLAVAVNEEVIPKSKYSECKLKEGDKVEIVNIVGGG
ncbi:MAG: sulfur carrier protein ThiS [Aquificaceae bacterium]|nr:sulfur carrier protein ThiS [Aquificaceae bacterium]